MAPAVNRWTPDWHQRLNKIMVDLPFRPLLDQAEIRRTLAADPVAFALIYLRHHLQGEETGKRITFSEVHYDWARLAEEWKTPSDEPMAHRHSFIAPRGTGKSTWWFLILPLWAAANGYVRFVAAFAHSAGQAEGHLQTLKHELDTNPLLRHDYPDLCAPARRPTGATTADRQSMLHTKTGFTFAARGVDAASLGMKVQEHRPDLLILDDVEPDEASYSPYLAEKRLSTITDAIFPLNIYAKVVLVGTVTMPGSVTHQLVKAAQGVEVAAWIKEELITAHHHRAILLNDDGTERSVWPEKWPLAWLQGRRHTREYAKNYDNDPLAREGVYWQREDFQHGELLGVTRTLLAVDPAVTTKSTSDFTGLAVVSFSPSAGKVLIRHAAGVRLTGQPLRTHVIDLLGRYPEIKAILVETNQGGDLWPEVFHHLPNTKILTHTASSSKEVRFAEALEHWQRGRVLHSGSISILEEQAVAFPRGAYDDVIDAAVSGVRYFLSPEKKTRSSVQVSSYV